MHARKRAAAAGSKQSQRLTGQPHILAHAVTASADYYYYYCSKAGTVSNPEASRAENIPHLFEKTGSLQ